MTPKQEAALRLAADAIDEFCELGAIIRPLEVRDAIREALAEPKEKYQYGTPLLDAMTGKTEQPAHVAAVNTSPERVDKTSEIVHEAQRTWVGLTDEEVDECYYWKGRQWTTDELVRHVEAKLREKNNG